MNVIYRQSLPWPAHKSRCAERKRPAFSHGGRPVNIPTAAKRVADQVSGFSRVGKPWRTTELVICTLAQPGKRGGLLSDPPRGTDPGAVVTFDLDRRTYTIACDRYETIAGNLCAIAAYIEGLRANERHGVADLGEMLAGHLALPGPSPRPTWWEVLGVAKDAPMAEIEAKYRSLAREQHPDHGGTHDQMAALNAAIQSARKARGVNP